MVWISLLPFQEASRRKLQIALGPIERFFVNAEGFRTQYSKIDTYVSHRLKAIRLGREGRSRVGEGARAVLPHKIVSRVAESKGPKKRGLYTSRAVA